MPEESRREVAEQIVNQIAVGAWLYCSRQWVMEMIEAALKERDERAAKIAETHAETHGNMHFGRCEIVIAAAIRGKSNA